MKFQPYLKAVVRGSPGIAIELLRLDAASTEDLTEGELEVAEETKEEASSTAIMRIYEDIGEDPWSGGGITVKRFAEELDAFGDIRRLNLHINSLGGDVFTGHAIYNIIVDHKAKYKRSYIDGIAASAATIVASAAQEVVARENTNYMIHPPWMMTIGNKEDHRKAVEILDAIETPIIKVYKAQVKDKIDEEKIRQLMEDETWMTANEALEYGFVDYVRGKIKAIAKINQSQILCSGRVMNFERHGFRNVPRFPAMKLSAPKAPEAKEKPTMDQTTKKKMTKEDIEPSLIAEIEASARATERVRLDALDAMSSTGLDEIIAKAKATDGVQPKDIAMECLEVTRGQLKNAEAIKNLAVDAAVVSSVAASVAPPTRTPKISLEKQGIELVQNAFKELASRNGK